MGRWFAMMALVAACGAKPGGPAAIAPVAEPTPDASPPDAALVTATAPDAAVACVTPPTDAEPIELDADPSTTEVISRATGCGLRCNFALFAERHHCWIALGTVDDVMSSPSCLATTKGAYCTLDARRLMIHGEAYDFEFPFVGAYGEAMPGESPPVAPHTPKH